MTKELADTLPPLYANDGADDPDAVVARVKLFSPYNGWRWYITEWEAETGTCFGSLLRCSQGGDEAGFGNWREFRSTQEEPEGQLTWF